MARGGRTGVSGCMHGVRRVPRRCPGRAARGAAGSGDQTHFRLSAAARWASVQLAARLCMHAWAGCMVHGPRLRGVHVSAGRGYSPLQFWTALALRRAFPGPSEKLKGAIGYRRRRRRHQLGCSGKKRAGVDTNREDGRGWLRLLATVHCSRWGARGVRVRWMGRDEEGTSRGTRWLPATGRGADECGSV